jgi:glycosyltransferase involved in cell wall biosynthesis
MPSQISVAMATYNGAAYVGEQLASIAAQSVLPDELIVCDDVSTDATVSIVERFAAGAPFPVHLHLQSRNLGAAGNFATAAAKCRGRWIALADQDDLWLPDKLAALSAAIASRPDEVGLVFSDAEAVDPLGQSLGYTLWRAIRFGRPEQAGVNAGGALDVLIRHNVAAGATMMFRADFRDLLLPVPPGWLHDGWFALLTAACATVAAVPRPLVRYRQHPSQQIGAPRLFEQYVRGKKQGREHFEAVASLYEAAAARLAQHPDRVRDATAIAKVLAKAAHVHSRAAMRASPWRWPKVCRELLRGGYRRYSSGWRSLAQDLFL